MDFRLLAALWGRVACALSLALLLPLLLAVYDHETDFLAFAATLGVSLLTGCVLCRTGSRERDWLRVREGILFTVGGCLMLALLGMLPYVLCGLRFIDSFFESVSGFTGTGATVVPSLAVLPDALVFWRCFTHWLGGFFIIAMFSSVLPQIGCGDELSSGAPAWHTMRCRLPQAGRHALSLFILYALFTFLVTFSYMLCGLDFTDAAGHAFSTVSTGGFSMYDENVRFFDNPMLEFCMVVFMLIAGGNFALYRQVYKRGWRVMRVNTELRAYVLLLGAIGLFMTVNLISAMGMEPVEAVRYAIFQEVSISTTTGFFSADFSDWPQFSQGCLLLLMLIGGCSGSSAGGLRVIRVVLLVKLMYWIVWQKLYPQSPVAVHMNGYVLPERVLFSVGRFFFMFIMLCAFWSLLLTLDGVPLLDALAIAASAMSGAGPALGIASPAATYAALPDFSKAVSCAAMLFGRLELFPFFVLFWPEFWQRKRGW